MADSKKYFSTTKKGKLREIIICFYSCFIFFIRWKVISKECANVLRFLLVRFLTKVPHN